MDHIYASKRIKYIYGSKCKEISTVNFLEILNYTAKIKEEMCDYFNEGRESI